MLDEAATSLEALQQIDDDNIEWSLHATAQVLQRRGLHHDYVEDVVARPYGEVYRQRASDRLILYDPDTETAIGKPRAVMVAVDRRTAHLITAYNVDEGRRQQFESEDGYEWLASLTD